MTIQEFKREAQRRGRYYDNSESAAENWSKSWGLTYHSLLWFYKDFKLGNMEWKGGKVRLRHGSYQSVECRINGEYVSEYRFKKALASFVAPELTEEERQYIDEQEKALEARLLAYKNREPNHRYKKKAKVSELSLAFAS